LQLAHCLSAGGSRGDRPQDRHERRPSTGMARGGRCTASKARYFPATAALDAHRHSSRPNCPQCGACRGSCRSPGPMPSVLRIDINLWARPLDTPLFRPCYSPILYGFSFEHKHLNWQIISTEAAVGPAAAIRDQSRIGTILRVTARTASPRKSAICFGKWSSRVSAACVFEVGSFLIALECSPAATGAGRLAGRQRVAGGVELLEQSSTAPAVPRRGQRIRGALPFSDLPSEPFMLWYAICLRKPEHIENQVAHNSPIAFSGGKRCHFADESGSWPP
jgi:hypothetical protein